MEIRDLTPVLNDTYKSLTRTDVKSVHYGEADPQDVQLAYEDPRAFAKAAGVQTGEESQYHITTVQREDRHKGLTAAPGAARRARRPIIVVIHYACCCGEILILGW
jgi:hypothetical protein